MEIFNTMNEKGWNATANLAGILSLVSIVLFLFRLFIGKLDFWTILLFSLIVTGAVAYALIHMILKVRTLTPAEESVANQVSDTKEFVGFFFSLLVMLTMAVGTTFFSETDIGKTVGSFLFAYTAVSLVIKIYDIQRLTSARKAQIQLETKHNFGRTSRAEQLGLLLAVIGLIGSYWIPSCSVLVFIGLNIFLVRPIVNRVEGRIIDLFLMWVNFVMVGISAALILFK
jgi:hypothetical protein